LNSSQGPGHGAIYEQEMATNRSVAMNEASQFFEGQGRVQETLRRITQKVADLGVPYCVAGGMSLFQHGYRRYTEDVNLLVTREGLNHIHERLEGLGFVRLFRTSKGMRDVQTGVKIDFLVTGGFPGDGKPKPVAFPHPDSVFEEFDGIRYMNLPSLLALKLASGISNPERGKDLVDVAEVVKAKTLPRTFGEQLPEYVREEFISLWDRVFGGERFIRTWAADGDPDMLQRMLADGLVLDTARKLKGVEQLLFTSDPQRALQYDLHPEEEFDLDALLFDSDR
jgi:hypothetical protein